jgi:hypothetical protein
MIVKASKLVFELAFTLTTAPRPILTRIRVFDERSYIVSRMMLEAKCLGQLSKSRFIWIPMIDGREQHRAVPVYRREKGRYVFCEASFNQLTRRYITDYDSALELDSFGRIRTGDLG